MNSNKFFWCLIPGIIILLFYVGCPASAESGKSFDEWKEILAIGDDIDPLVGAELKLTVNPSWYYQITGDEIVLNGSLTGVFGPFQDTRIIIEEWNKTGSRTEHEVITDNYGYFYLNTILEEEGLHQFQANLTSSSEILKEPLKSEKLEIVSNPCPDGFCPFTDDVSKNTSDFEQVISGEPDNTTGSVSLSVFPSFFYPGEPVLLSGKVLDGTDIPVPYSRVLLHLNSAGDDISTEGVIEGFTSRSGLVTFNLSVPGPYPISCVLEYSGNNKGSSLWSNYVVLTPTLSGINPPAKTISDEEGLELSIKDTTIPSLQNMTLYGWYKNNDESDRKLQVLELVWYNFGGKFWDNYQNSSDILTNQNGKFECQIPAPETTGMYLLSVRKPGNTTRSPLYSDVQVITVISSESAEEAVYSEEFPVLHITSDQSYIYENETLNLSLRFYYPDNTPVPGTPLNLLFSNNGIDWTPLPVDNVMTGPDGTAPILLNPDRAGYWYFRAIAEDDSLNLISSETLVIPVLPFSGT